MATSGMSQILGRVKDVLKSVLRTKQRRSRAIEALPSRQYMQTTLIPALASAERRRMLFVGAQPYNLAFYRHCEALKIDVWSIDYDSASAPYGAPQGHFVGDIKQIGILAPQLKFDVIVFNGILGFGVNSPADAVSALEAMAQVAEPDALLIIGWNPGRTDGQEIVALRPRLTRATLGDLPSEIEFPAMGVQRDPHRYEIFKFGATEK